MGSLKYTSTLVGALGTDCEGDGSLLIVKACPYAFGIPSGKKDTKANIDINTNGMMIT
jgi:hypothetical protein